MLRPLLSDSTPLLHILASGVHLVSLMYAHFSSEGFLLDVVDFHVGGCGGFIRLYKGEYVPRDHIDDLPVARRLALCIMIILVCKMM